MSGNILRLTPIQYAHVLDLNSNITHVKLGPSTLILQDNQKLVLGPETLVIIPPGSYCVVTNPVKQPVEAGLQAELHFGHEEYRFHQAPFPLYPGEILKSSNKVKSLPKIASGEGLRLQALVDFTDEKDVLRRAGEQWIVEGPKTFYPRSELQMMGAVKPFVVKHNTALYLKALRDIVDKNGKNRFTGEEWLECKLR